MSDIKEVKVSLQDADVKALSRTTTRRRRNRNDLAGVVGGEEVKVEKETVVAASVPSTEAIPLPALLPNPLPPTPAVLPPPPTSIPLGGAVRIVGKKSHSSAAQTHATRINPHKKRITAVPPAQMLTKPKLHVPSHNTAEKDKEKKTRRFKERKISITVAGAATTRKERRNLKEKVDAMPVSSVRKLLLRKGILQAKASNPPEEMLRSMLHDYMMLHSTN